MTQKLVGALIALVVLAGAGTVSGIQTATQDSLSTAQNEADAGFGTDEITVSHGGTATIPIRLDGTDTATVKIGSDDAVNYALVVTVEDGNDDGRVTLSFDTDAVAEQNQTKVWTDVEADSATVRTEVEHLNGDPPKPPLDVATYPITLYDGRSTDAEAVDEMRMHIVEATTTTTADTTRSTASESTTTESTTTEPTTDEPTTSETERTELKATETTTDVGGDVPGFGPVLALVAFAAVATLLGRR